MCGILGVIPAQDPTLFNSALQKLNHRGPDGTGVFSDGNHVSLGHKRLAILDLTDEGRQPMTSLCGRFTITYNGEIYNFVELKDDLQKRGYHFKSTSDTEVLLNAYIEWREGCLNKFNGMWSFAVWDRKKKTLFLARDRFGKKPLFYSIKNNFFVFASEMKAVAPFLREISISKQFDKLKNNLFTYETSEYTLIENIKRFPAGSFGIYRSGAIKIKRYWNTLDHIHGVPTTYGKQVDKFRELIFDACRIRMRSDVPIGTALSGGLDSSAIISIMAVLGKSNVKVDRIASEWQHAFIATFPNTPLDESEYAKKVLNHIRISGNFLDINPHKEWGRLDDYLYLFEELFVTSPIPMMKTYEAIKQNGISVSIDGHGADETLGGYMFSIFHALPDARFIGKNAQNVFETYKNMLPEDEAQFEFISKSLLSYPKFLSKEFIKYILGKNSNKPKNNIEFQKLDRFNKHLYVLVHNTILPTLLRNYDRYSMATGVEIRMPFMDHRLVTYCLSLPWNSKIRRGYTKSILRDAVKGILPEDIRMRKLKIGFNTPIFDWMRGPLKSYFKDEIHSVDFKHCNLIRPNTVKKKINYVINHPRASFLDAERAWSAFLPYLWEKAFLKRIQKQQWSNSV